MKKIVIFILYEIIFSQIQNDNVGYLSQGYYEINSYLTNLYLSMNNKKLINFKYKICISYISFRILFICY